MTKITAREDMLSRQEERSERSEFLPKHPDQPSVLDANPAYAVNYLVRTGLMQAKIKLDHSRRALELSK
jgi:hypothetical protein